MSETECGAICVRKDVMEKFNVIMEETKLDANELMEHFFGLYNCCVKLVHPNKTTMAQNSSGINSSHNLNQHQMIQQMQHQQHRQHSSEVKTENDDFIPVGMTYNTNPNLADGSGSSKNSSLSENDEVTCLGVTQIGGDCSVEDKVQLLQRLREQANSTNYNNNNSNNNNNSSQHGGGNYHNFNSYSSSSMGPPSMVPLPNAGHFQGDSNQPKKRKKKPKRAKLCQAPAQAVSISDGEDLLKSSMCSLCQAVFARFTDLLAHHKSVHNSDTSHPLRCRACGRTQTSEAGLIYHQVYVCKMVERPHPCHICGLKFQSEEMVLVHKCSGCPRKKYACEFCDHYRTESSSDLEKHMRIHTNDKCYVCRVCGFSTAWKKNLKEHMVKHLGLKPYVCDLCGYSTSDRHNLRAHRLKHYQKGEGCEKCGGECHCNKPLAIKKRKMSTGSIGDGSGGGSPGAAVSPGSGSGKELECPYPQCVYRTKTEYMMTNHMLRHQGMADQNLGGAGSGTGTSGNSGGDNSVNNNANNNNNTATSSGNNPGGGGGSGGGGGNTNAYHSTSHNAQEQSKSSHHRGQGVIANSLGGQYGGGGGHNAASPASSISSSSSIPPSSMSNNQNGPPTLVSSTPNHLPLEWKTIGQPPLSNVHGVLSPPSHFSPLHHQQGPLASQTMSSWAGSPLSPPAVPPGLLSNRVSVQMSGQNMVARPMPVFPNMPN